MNNKKKSEDMVIMTIYIEPVILTVQTCNSFFEIDIQL